MNSVYVRHSKELNDKNGIRDFYMFDDRGKLVINGSMGLDKAFENIKDKIAIRDSCNTLGASQKKCSLIMDFFQTGLTPPSPPRLSELLGHFFVG